MRVPGRVTIGVLSLLMAPLAQVGVASAQDVYKVNYFDNNGSPPASDFAGLIPSGKVRIDNPGLTFGNLCAMIYVFDADQQMAECCGCIETRNGLRKLSIQSDLTHSPLTGNVPVSGMIKVVSAAVNSGPSCDPSANVSPKPNLRIWVTHIQDGLVSIISQPGNPGVPSYIFGSHPQTETESSDSPLGAMELANLQAQCSFIHIQGSGHGICTCGTGD